MKNYLKIFCAAVAALTVVGCQQPPVVPVDGAKAPVVALSTITVTNATATVKISAARATEIIYTHYTKDARPEEAAIAWEKLAIEDADEKTIEIACEALSADVVYTFEAYATRTDNGTEVKSASVTKDFTIGKAQNISMNNLTTSPFRVKSDVAYSQECKGYIVEIWEKSNTSVTPEDLADAIDNPSEDPQTWKVVHTSNVFTQGDLIPDTEYIMAYVGAKAYNERVGDVLSLEFKTPAFNIDQCDAATTLGTVTATQYTIDATVNRAEGVYEVMTGAVKKSVVGDKTIRAYLDEWLVNFNKNGQMHCKMVLINPFHTEGEEAPASIQISKGSDIELEPIVPGTDYIFWAIALDANGNIGQLVSKDVKTSEYLFESTATVELAAESISINGKEVTFSAKMANGCTKIAYFNWTPFHTPQNTPKSEILKMLVTALKDNDRICETDSFVVKHLDKNSKYTLYVMPVDAEGKYGEITTIEYNTNVPDITFLGNSKLTVTVGERYMKEYNKVETPHYNVTVTKGENCDGFYYYYAGVTEWTALNLNSVAMQAIHAIEHNLTDNFVTEDLIEHAVPLSSEYNNDFYFFAIPFQMIDGERVFGEPDRTMLFFNAVD